MLNPITEYDPRGGQSLEEGRHQTLRRMKERLPHRTYTEVMETRVGKEISFNSSTWDKCKLCCCACYSGLAGDGAEHYQNFTIRKLATECLSLYQGNHDCDYPNITRAYYCGVSIHANGLRAGALEDDIEVEIEDDCYDCIVGSYRCGRCVNQYKSAVTLLSVCYSSVNCCPMISRYICPYFIPYCPQLGVLVQSIACFWQKHLTSNVWKV
ncbi:MAG: hypothetical protein ACHQUC_00615 [Chlamydiales bacterium]